MRKHARVVVIGGGIFGASTAYHLAKAGCTDIVLVEKGELTSGTTFHSVGLVSQFRTSPALMKLINYTIGLFNQFKEETGEALGWHTVGSLRLASSRDRLKALQREVSRARAIGIDAEIVSPKECLRISPFLSDQSLYGAVWVPDDGHIDPSKITYELAGRAKRMGAEIVTQTRVTGIRLSPSGCVEAVETDQGTIQTECLVNAAGEWAPRIGEMAGVHLPMVPLMHQYITTKPIPDRKLPPDTPVVRDPDRLFYCREDTGAFLIGGFELNPKDWMSGGVPWEFTQQLLNPEWDLFEPVMQGAIERIPLLGEAEVVRLVNGPDAFTPDGRYALGPVPGVVGYYVAAGGSINGIAGAGGVGKVMAEWIIEGAPSIDVYDMNVKRLGVHMKGRYLVEQCREVYKNYYHLHYPSDESEWGRPLRKSPFYDRLKELGAVFGHKNGWERANYFDPGRPWRQAGAEQNEWGWDKPPYFARVGQEARAARQKVVLIDMSSFGKIEVSGSGALPLLQRLAANDLEKPVGSLTYTQFLNTRGGIESDVTIARLGPETFRIVTGTAFASSDIGWIRMHAPGGEAVSIKDVTENWGVLSLWGPHSREVLKKVTASDLSNKAFPYMSGSFIQIGGSEVWAQRISYVGELGWELYTAPEAAASIFDALLAAGSPFGIEPMGYKALESLRVEKGYLYWSGDITPSDNPLEAGLGSFINFEKGDFIGRDALLEFRKRPLEKTFRAVLLDAAGNLYGGESVYREDRIVERIRTAAYGYTVGKDIGLAYLPQELAAPGTELQVEVLGERIPARVALLPLVDRKGEALRK